MVHVFLLVVSSLVQDPESGASSAAQPASRHQDLVMWNARRDFADALRESVRVRLGDREIQKGNLFQRTYVDQQIAKLISQDPQLASYMPTEAEQITATWAAYGELVDVLIQVRDIAKQRMATKQRKEAARASQASFGPPLAPMRTRGDAPLDVAIDAANAITYANEMAKWRTDVASRVNAAFQVGSIGANMSDLENALRDSMAQATAKLDARIQQFIPGLVADGYVRLFLADGLLQDCVRSHIIDVPKVNVSETKDPRRLREVVFDVTDAFGTKRIGTVVIFQTNANEWVPSKDNTMRGGFYELRSAETE